MSGIYVGSGLAGGGGGGTQVVEYTHTRPTLTNNTSSVVIAANPDRKVGSYFMNTTDATLYLAFDDPAIFGEGIQIYPAGVFKFDTTQAINALQGSGGDVVIDVYEAL